MLRPVTAERQPCTCARAGRHLSPLPLFAELKDRGHVRSTVQLMHASAGEAAAHNCLKTNDESIRAFDAWSQHHTWQRRLVTGSR